MIDHDNVLPHDLWFQNMVQPFLEHKDVIGVETLRYHYDPHASLLDRYFALFGAGDPLVWYLGKADRLSYIYDTYQESGIVKDCGSILYGSISSGYYDDHWRQWVSCSTSDAYGQCPDSAGDVL